MCIFSREVRHVGATRVFAGHRDDGRQALIYALGELWLSYADGDLERELMPDADEGTAKAG